MLEYVRDCFEFGLVIRVVAGQNLPSFVKLVSGFADDLSNAPRTNRQTLLKQNSLNVFSPPSRSVYTMGRRRRMKNGEDSSLVKVLLVLSRSRTRVFSDPAQTFLPVLTLDRVNVVHSDSQEAIDGRFTDTL